MTPRRILMTADAVGGVWQYAVTLGSLLTARRAEVRVVTMGPEPSAAQRAEATGRRIGVRSGSFALEWMPGAWDEVDAAGEWLLACADEFAPDVIHLNGYCHAHLGWRAPTVVVAHSCVCSWWEAVRGARAPAEYNEYIRRVTEGLAAATAVVTPSAALRDALARLYGVRTPVRVIPNAISPLPAGERPKEPIVFSAGRVWDPAKNLTMLDAVASEVPWPVVVAGDPRDPSGGAGALRHARALGYLPSRAVREWMVRAAIYALPARYEPFGLSVLEAAHAGCALVLGDIPSLRENWSGVARFVHPGSADELHQALAELIADAEERDALGRAARRRAAWFSPERHVRAYQMLYHDLARADAGTLDSARAL